MLRKASSVAISNPRVLQGLATSLRISQPAMAQVASRAFLVLSSRNSSSWAIDSPSSYSSRPANSRNRRPQVNGKAVAFHVKDLASMGYNPNHHSVTGPTSSTASSLIQMWANSAQPHQPTGYFAKERQYNSDLIVVLDMDECLIHSQFLSCPQSAQVYAHQLKQQRLNNSFGLPSKRLQVDSFRVHLPDGEPVHVNVRPGLHDFLEAVTSRFETHIMTAAQKVYADPVLDQLDPNGDRFAGRWYRDSCTFDAKRGAYVKRLEALPLDRGNLDRVVLVDNNPLSFLANPQNGILINSFYNDPHDVSLTAVWNLLQELDQHQDVRPLLEQRFGLEEALKKLPQQRQQDMPLQQQVKVA